MIKRTTAEYLLHQKVLLATSKVAKLFVRERQERRESPKHCGYNYYINVEIACINLVYSFWLVKRLTSITNITDKHSCLVDVDAIIQWNLP